ncbi:DUF4157 domain-containing protein, partial [Halobacterium salinarum]
MDRSQKIDTDAQESQTGTGSRASQLSDGVNAQRNTDTGSYGSTNTVGPGTAGPTTDSEYEQYYGVEIEDPAQAGTLQRLAESNGTRTVREWAEEGIPIDAMGNPKAMDAYRNRQGTPVPWDAERRNKRSKRRSEHIQRFDGGKPAGNTQVPDSVRDVISSPGQSLDASVQRAMEDRMDHSFTDVQVHAGPQAAEACEDINARAFTVGNHVAFNHGEYNP